MERYIAMPKTIESDIEPRAQSALRESPFYDLRNLKVEFVDGTLLISGSVACFYHKQLAQEAVRLVAGGVQVINEVSVG